MQLSLLKNNALFTCVLPEKQSGQYWVHQVNSQGYEERVISVEGTDGKWILKSNRNVKIIDEQNQVQKELVIIPLSFYSLLLKNTNERVWLYSEPISNDRKSFRKLLLPTHSNSKLTIGRSEHCDIRYANMYASSKHAELHITEEELTITDLDSSNGTFINGLRIEKKVIEPGDVVYILGLKIIFGQGFIAVNNPDHQVMINEAAFKPFIKQQAERVDEDEEDSEGITVSKAFYRSPRFKRDIKRSEIKIDPPPSLGNTEQTPLMLMLGPSITMGMSALFMGLFTLMNVLSTGRSLLSAMPTLVMSFSMLLGTILWPILTRRHESKKRREREKIRQEKYKAYLEEIKQKITDECKVQSHILHENHETVKNCAARIQFRMRNLWERTNGQNDFLKLRLGLGSVPMNTDIKFPEKRFTLEEDKLQEELYNLAEFPKVLEKVPITLSLTEDRISGVIGGRDNVLAFTNGLILQLTALHSYDELKLIFIYDKSEQSAWEYVKWLPHAWSQEKGMRFIATSPNEVKELSAYLEKEITKRENLSSNEDLKSLTPYYVVFAINKSLVSKAEAVNTILHQKQNHGFSVIHLYDELHNLPKECSWVIELEHSSSKIYDKNDITGRYMAFQPDIYVLENDSELAIDLANIHLEAVDGAYTLPSMLTFLEMFEVGKIEHLNALARWKENDPTITLEAPIGVSTTGDLFNLDLHEKFHGPHGLIAGMTGSGKSEFIMTFILSLAVNYHPHEVAFILIDYKGGGMAHAFANLPHLAGTITNLDGAAVKRSLVSIQSELKRRQAIFNEASKVVNISNIDIYKYQKLYREGKVREPLQHLFMISDEFAELKTQQPAFMEQLVSAARIGRSLGVHLILATQKPSGVVDDQIWSNSKFRICLKVQEKADSMDVIKRPDAAELSVTGRYYVQVGFNELFELGQSAWAGAPYYPTDRVEKQQDDSVTVIDNLGRVMKQVRMDKKRKTAQNPPKQIDEINTYLASIARAENIKVKPLWLEPIPEFIYIDELKAKYQIPASKKCMLNPVIGEVDDPANQRQFAMTFPLSEEGNAVIYGAAGNGKTTFITSLVYSLLNEHTPAELHVYIFDFGAETLRMFSSAPHIGDVVLSHEAEKTNNFFKKLHKEIERRKKLFADYGGDYRSYIKASIEDIPSIVVIIHNYSAFTETYDDKEEALAYLTREGLKYGIYFILTVANTSAVRYRLLQNFKQIYVLQLNDQSEYSGVLGNVEGVFPSKLKGRGIYKSDSVYEFQIAHVHPRVEDTFSFVRQYCNEYATRWTQATATKIPILPDKVDIAYLSNELRNSQNQHIPIGVAKEQLTVTYYPFDHYFVSLVLSQNSDKAHFTQGLSEVIQAKTSTEVIVLDAESTFEEDSEKKYIYVNAATELEQMIIELFNTLVYRNNTYKDALEKGEKAPSFDKITCIIQSLSALMKVLSEDAKDKLKVLLEKGDHSYNVFFIIADSVAAISSFSFESWFKAKVSLSDGIWIGNGIADQYQLKVSKVTNAMYQEIGDDFGYMLTRGKVTLVKLLASVTSDTGVEIGG